MTRARKLLFTAIGSVLIGTVIAGAYQYDLTKQRQADEAVLMVETGIDQFQKKQYEATLETLRSIPQGFIKDWRIPYYQGATHIRLRDYEAAVVSLEQALSLNSREEEIPFALGVAYFKLGNLSLSKSYFHTVLEINPNHADAKGLMDIMANLKRLQPDKSAADSKSENTGVTENGSQPGADLTSPSGTVETTGN